MHLPPNAANYARIEKHEDIPDIYAAIQIMTNDSGKVVAYTWNGETYTICTPHGEFKGANVKELDETYFE